MFHLSLNDTPFKPQRVLIEKSPGILLILILLFFQRTLNHGGYQEQTMNRNKDGDTKDSDEKDSNSRQPKNGAK